MKKHLILLVVLWILMVQSASAQELSGSDSNPKSGQTAVTASVEDAVPSSDEDQVKTGDSNDNLVYISLFLMSGVVILAQMAGWYKTSICNVDSSK